MSYPDPVTRLGATPLQELVASRELLRNLTTRELKVRYKRSSLGFFWTLLNPLLMMAVFTVVLGSLFGSDIPDFPIYFLTGYLPFAFFQASVMVASGSVVNNAGLITKVYFPRAVLPLSVVLSQLVHYMMSNAILLVALIVVGYNFWPYLPVFVFGVALLCAFTSGLAMLIAAATTFLRDISEFLPVAFLLLFYATPVIYSIDQLPEYRWLINLNPMTHYVNLLRSATYELRMPGLTTTLFCIGCSAVTLVIGYRVFTRYAARFAKEV